MALDLCWEGVEELNIKIPDNVVCTVGPFDEEFTHTLDIGSALLSDKNELFGIASWYERGHSTKVYVGVFANLPWIETVMEQQ